MLHLDYLSCFLTILATVLVSRKSWTGLLISIVNSIVVCVIGFRTSQFGFIPANLICICVYSFNIRSWVKKTQTHGDLPGDRGWDRADGDGQRSSHRDHLGPRLFVNRSSYHFIAASRENS